MVGEFTSSFESLNSIKILKPIFHQKLHLHWIPYDGIGDKQHEIDMPNVNPTVNVIQRIHIP